MTTLNPDPTAELADLIEELTERFQRGATPDLEAVLRQYPQYGQELRDLLPALEWLGGLSRTRPDAESAAEEPTVGTLGDFRIIREVGRGGMGVVYEAEQLSLGRRVALKVLPFAATLDPRQLQRFRHEARAAAALHHPNIAPVYFVGCERGVHFYAMQLIDGGPLTDVVFPTGFAAGTGAEANAETRPVAVARTELDPARPEIVRRVVELGVQVADALEYAHGVGVVHRDVKPGNLLLDRTGRVWVVDFGLAKCAAGTGVTVAGELLGTLRYMSPEQALAKHNLVDHRSDVYSLAVTLYELLTGAPAFDGRDRQVLLRQIAFDEPTPVRRLNPAVPVELETVLHKAMAKDPAERYPSAGELADDLRRWLADKPVNARRRSVGQRAARWARRNRALVVTLVGLLGITAAGTTAANLFLLRAREAEVRQKQRADANWRKAFEALDQICLKMAEDRLPRESRPTPADRELIAKLLNFYEDFVRENGSDPAVRHQAARAYRRVGDLCRKLGRPAEAVTAYRRAVDRGRALVAEYPDDTTYRADLAAALDRLGFTLKNTGDRAEAEEAARASLRYRDELTAARPGDRTARQELARSYNLLGLVLADAGRTDEAEAAHREALSIREELLADGQTDRWARNEVAASCINLAHLRWKAGQLSRATEFGRRALNLWEELVAEAPWDPFYRQWCGKTCRMLCAIGPTDRPAESERLARRAVELHRVLAEQFPGLPEHRHDLAASWNELGRHLSKFKRIDAAEDAYRTALKVIEPLADRMPTQSEYRCNVGDTLANLARAARERGDATEADRLWDQAVSHYQRAVDLNPGVERYRDKLKNGLGGASRLPVRPAGESDLPGG